MVFFAPCNLKVGIISLLIYVFIKIVDEMHIIGDELQSIIFKIS
jgi:hypothetical protein